MEAVRAGKSVLESCDVFTLELCDSVIYCLIFNKNSDIHPSAAFTNARNGGEACLVLT